MESEIRNPITQIDEPIYYDEDIQAFTYNKVCLQTLANICSNKSTSN